MDFKAQFKERLFNTTVADFSEKALELFRFQAENNPVYREFIQHLGTSPNQVTTIEEIPFMPVEFFKGHQIRSGEFQEEVIFTSSGTTGTATSRHFVSDASFYLANTVRIFEHFYGKLDQYVFLCLLPSYLEREGSSLILMAEHFIKESNDPNSGFYLYNHDELADKLGELATSPKKVVLLGVSFALLDFAEAHPQALENTIVMETGGMKGRRKELVRDELHEILKKALQIPAIHSEYGMTELLSQAYSKGNGLFQTPPWMKIMLRDVYDPLRVDNSQRAGAINIIDLANVDSCAFIATQDLGRYVNESEFEVLGRIDHSDIRGCNLLI